MLYVHGTVASAAQGSALIEVDGKPACDACAKHVGCGLGPVMTLFGSGRARTLVVPDPWPQRLTTGDRVRISLPATSLTGYAVLSYGMPLVGLVGGAILAVAVIPSAGDGVAILGAVIGALVVSLSIKWRLRLPAPGVDVIGIHPRIEVVPEHAPG